MAADNNKEKRFSEQLEKLLKGEPAPPGSDAELNDDLDFARRLTGLTSDPSPVFKASLERRLLDKLAERERGSSGIWRLFAPETRWISFTATAAVILLAVVGFFGYRTLFYQPASAPSAPAFSTPDKTTTPSMTSVPQTPTTPTTTPRPSPPAAESPQQSPGFSGPPMKTGGTAQVSWAYHFENLYDLTAFSDEIVTAAVIKAGEPVRQGSFYTTQWALQVNQVLKGEQVSTIIVSQTGSPEIQNSDPQDDPLFKPGELYLLFLRKSASGVYSYPGPAGRYLWDGGIYSMNRIIYNGGGYQPAPELDFVKKDPQELITSVKKLADSVQFIFTQGAPKLQADTLRCLPGTTLSIEARLSSGEHGPAGVTLSITQYALTAGLDVKLQPAVFVAQPRSEYVSSITISVSPTLAPGAYRIPINYDFGGSFTGQRVITLNVEK